MSGSNPLAQFKLTDYTKDAGSTYIAKLDSNNIVAQRVVDNFGVHQQQTANMTAVVEPGHILQGTTLVEVGAQTTLSLTNTSTSATVLSAAGISNGYVIIASGVSNNATVSAISGLTVTLSTAATTTASVPATFCQVTGVITAPAGNPRIDRIVANRATGLISVITGTPAAAPTPPAITSGTVPLAQILLQTSSTSITNSMLTDERCIEAMGRGTAGEYTAGTGANNIVQLDSSSRLPAVDASQVTGISALNMAANGVTSGSYTSANITINSKGLIVSAASGTPGILVQHKSYETGAVATGSGTFTLNDTIPTTSNGTEYMSLAITPTSPTNILVIKSQVIVSTDNGNNSGYVGLHQDSTANSLAALPFYFSNNGIMQSPPPLCHIMAAGITTATTFKIRVGSTAGTVTFNGINGARIFGGVLPSTIDIYEYTQ